MAGLRLYWLGSPVIELDGQPIELETRKATALLAYLSLNQQSFSRESLATLFWPEFDSQHALTNLRRTLFALNRDLPLDLLETSREAIGWREVSDVWLDVNEFHRLLNQVKAHLHPQDQPCHECLSFLQTTVELARGEFMAGFNLPDCPEFDDWQYFQRESLRKEVSWALESLSQVFAGQGEAEQAIAYARRLVALDRLHEPAQRLLMSLYAQAGQRSHALHQFEELTTLLQEELDQKPEKETQALFESIRTGKPLGAKDLQKATISWEQLPEPGEPPYKGLSYFDEKDADLFFGRERLTALLAGYLRDQPLLVVIGASGSGKSSVVRAGLIPALKRGQVLADGSLPPRGSSDWVIRVITPTTHPLTALNESLTEELKTSDAPLLTMIEKEPDSLDERAKQFLAQQGAIRLLLVVDQFEEVFTLCKEEAECRRFIDQLLEAVGPGRSGQVMVVIALRADFYAHCGAYPQLSQALAHHQEYIPAMSSEELQQAIELPALKTGWELQPGLVDQVLADTREEPGALPLLSHALLETWQRRSGRIMTIKGYTESGGVRGAIAQTAERVFFQKLAPNEQGLARNIFLRLTELGQGTQDTCRRAPLSELVPSPDYLPQVQGVLEILAGSRLITLSEETAEVAHEALIREWPLLRQWLREDREGLLLHRHLTEASQDWEDMDRDEGELYRGTRLIQALEWAEAHPDQVNQAERAFLEASRELADRQVNEREAQRQKELEAAQQLAEAERRRAEEESQSAKRLRQRAIYLSLALITAFGIMLVAVILAQISAQRGQLAQARELTTASVSNLAADPEGSILLAMQAIKTAHIPEAENALHLAVLASRLSDSQVVTEEPNLLYGIAFAPDGLHFATACGDNTIKIWSLDPVSLKIGRDPLLTILNPIQLDPKFSNTGYTLAFSPDGSRLAAISEKNTTKIWDTTNGKLLHTLYGHSSQVFSVIFSPDGKLLTSAGNDGLVRVYDVESGRPVSTLSGQNSPVSASVFRADGKELVSGDSSGKIIVWEQNPDIDASSHEELFTRSFSFLINYEVNAIAISPNGENLAVAYYSGKSGSSEIRVYDLTSIPNEGMPRLLYSISAHENGITRLSYSPDGTRLVSGSLDAKAKVWDTVTGQALFTLPANAGGVNGLALSSDGERLITANIDRTVRVWDLTSNGSREWLNVPVANIPYFFGEGDRQVDIAANDLSVAKITIREFSPTGTRDIGSFTINTGFSQYTFDVDRDLSWLAATINNFVLGYGVAGWDLATGKLVGIIYFRDYGINEYVFNLKFSPDRLLLATVGQEGEVILWDIPTGKPIQRMQGQNEFFTRSDLLAFSPDSIRLAIFSSGGVLQIWDARSGSLLKEFPGSTGLYPVVCFSPDGKHLLATGEGATLKLWDISTGQLKFTLPAYPALIQHIAFSPDGKYIVASRMNDTTQLWDANTGKELLNLAGSYASFTGDGKHLFLYNRKLSLAQGIFLDINELMTLARSRLTRSWDLDECQKFLHTSICPPTP